MDGSEITGEGVNFSPPPSVVGIAISGDKNSKYIVRWALDKFVPEGNVFFKLIHVRPRITGVPTPMGSRIPISQVREDVVAAYRKEMEWQASEKLVPYKKMCASRKMQVDVVLVESDDVANAIAEEVAMSAICNLVLGAPSRGIFKRKQNGLSSKISACTPRFCTVYAVSKGKLSSVRASDAESVESVKYENSDTCSVSSSSSNTSSSQTGTDRGSVSSNSHFRSPSLPMQRFQALTNINQTLLSTKKNSNDTIHSRCQSQDLGSFVTDCQSWTSDQASTSDVVTDYSPESQTSQATFNLELEKLRIELRHAKGMYAMAQSETMDASRKIYNLNKLRLEEAVRLKEINSMEEKAIVSATQEKEKYESAKKEADYMRECVKREVAHRREAEMQAMHDAKEKEKLEHALVGPVQQYQKFSWDEIVTSTSSFSEDLKIGMGAYGTVYKGNFHHTTAAVKVLHSIENRQTKQFQQELEILSKIRHPHLLLLLGACPDHSCLVYEYMENGSLEDRLLQKNGTPPIPWFERFRIAWEVASTLVFLHSTKPKPIIHRDLKPANILLDHNLVSKIGDVGLATMLNSDPSMSSIYSDTGPVGTLSYIDPEYQRTGIISPQSDVYAFGMVILQLLTAKPARAITHLVETAVKDKNLTDVLDPKAGHWPMEETRQLAELGLSCAELRRRDRPDLKEQVVPLLERLKEVADTAKNSAPPVQCLPPNHFICPILKDVMDEPCVAADGYTYDRKAIEKWFEENNNSPMTNLPLPNKDVILNYTLLSAIMEWKTRKQ
ncbi:U-box domain-containing protein 35-like isoform X1 [Malus sylvestris]|uniref:U-box domain-containing protein 35-like isoform X1 n=1 Tax=Malus sylvestris TaxID=3752 RepID=UPI0021ACD938|nr:U-box domain-containing protein 35-like isoform X1 [Malus sylvestris]XP_050156737.1 U-box domain-containing protein 35-like isoform X1 [Malus sylvestris]